MGAAPAAPTVPVALSHKEKAEREGFTDYHMIHVNHMLLDRPDVLHLV